MRKEEFFRELSRKLSRLGWPNAHVRRTRDEVADHWDDLEHEARERGLNAIEASQFASERIGEPEELARLHHQTMRKAHWCGRHPVWSFAVLPPVTLFVWFMAWLLMAVGAGELYGKLLDLNHPFWNSFLPVMITAKAIHYTGLLAVPAFFCWWARRSFCGSRWGWIACAACAAHGLINHVTVRAHVLQWGYGIAIPDPLTVLAPLLVAAAAQSWQRLHWKVVTPLALAFLTACASPKQAAQERGWIGGEYKAVRACDALPHGGILVTRLQTNAPAARRGLREGDVIMRVGGQPVKDSRQFWRAIDKAQPGNTLALTLLRDDKTLQQDVLVGREVFKPNRSIVVGLLFAHEFDPWPNPDFSLVALGFKQQHQRVELNSPEEHFKRAHDGDHALHSREGWEVWLPILSFSNRKSIVSQTTVE